MRVLRFGIAALFAAGIVSSCEAAQPHRKPGRKPKLPLGPKWRAPKAKSRRPIPRQPAPKAEAKDEAVPHEIEDARRFIKSDQLELARRVLKRLLDSPRVLPAHVRRQAEDMLRDVQARISRKESRPGREFESEFNLAESLYWQKRYPEAKAALLKLRDKGAALPDPMRSQVLRYLADIETTAAEHERAQRAADRDRDLLFKVAVAHIKGRRFYQARNILVRLDACRSELPEERRQEVARYLDEIDSGKLEQDAPAKAAAEKAQHTPKPAEDAAAATTKDATQAKTTGIIIEITNPKQAVCTVNASVLYLMGTVRAARAVKDVSVIHNRTPLATRGLGGAAAHKGTTRVELSEKIALADGRNVIEIVATDGKTQASKVIEVTFTRERKALYGRSWAVVIGIDRYQKAPWKDMALTYAAKDAVDMAKLLHERFGFERERVSLLLDGRSVQQHSNVSFAAQVKPATLANITAALAALGSKRVAAEDRVLVFFAGHGHTMPLATGGEMGFLVPEDGGGETLGEYYSTTLPMQRLRETSDIIPAKHILFLVDACYSGLCTTERRGLPVTASRYVEKMAKLQVRQIITAGLKGEQVVESSKWGNSAFTSTLLRALSTGAADDNSDGYITGSELGKYLKPAVSNLTQGEQTPKQACFFGDGEFLFQVK